MKIALTGSTGLIGTILQDALRRAGFSVVPIVRRPRPSIPEAITWDPFAGVLDSGRLEEIDAVIHLAGENIMKRRWNDRQKAEITDSRILSTRTLVDAILRCEKGPKVLITASAVGIYGVDSGDTLRNEDSPPGQDFLASLCTAWEGEANRAEEAGVRVVSARMGMVLSARGGAFPKLLKAYRRGLGAKVGHGRQYLSWVGEDDLGRAFIAILNDSSLEGPINIVAGSCPQLTFSRTLSRTLGRPHLFRVPQFAIKAALGERGHALLLGGQRVEATKLKDRGFVFQADLESTLQGLLQ